MLILQSIYNLLFFLKTPEIFFEVIAFIAGICTGASLFPQLTRMIKRRNTKLSDISVYWLILSTIGFTFWVYFGILVSSIVLTVLCILQTILRSSMLGIKINSMIKHNEKFY